MIAEVTAAGNVDMEPGEPVQTAAHHNAHIVRKAEKTRSLALTSDTGAATPQDGTLHQDASGQVIGTASSRVLDQLMPRADASEDLDVQSDVEEDGKQDGKQDTTQTSHGKFNLFLIVQLCLALAVFSILMIYFLIGHLRTMEEQEVRPAVSFAADDNTDASSAGSPEDEAHTSLTEVVKAGATILKVKSTKNFMLSRKIVIDAGKPVEEVNKIVAFGSIILEHPVKFDHAPGSSVTMPKDTDGSAGSSQEGAEECDSDSSSKEFAGFQEVDEEGDESMDMSLLNRLGIEHPSRARARDSVQLGQDRNRVPVGRDSVRLQQLGNAESF